MEQSMIRLLKANEIECRAAAIKENGLSLLLYKDARVDQGVRLEAEPSVHRRKSLLHGRNL